MLDKKTRERPPRQSGRLPVLFLVVNGQLIRPGQDANAPGWGRLRKEIGAKRQGLAAKRRLGARWRESLYVVFNPELELLDGHLVLKPRAEALQEPPAAHLAESQWRTTAYLSFWGGKLFRWIAEVAGDSEAAELFYNRARRAIEESFGLGQASPHGLVWKSETAELRLGCGSDNMIVMFTIRPDRV